MSGKIPPESTLIFNIDLLEIRNGPRSHESFQEMDLNDDWKLSKAEVIFLSSYSFLCFSLSHHFLKNVFLKKTYFYLDKIWFISFLKMLMLWILAF